MASSGIKTQTLKFPEKTIFNNGYSNYNMNLDLHWYSQGRPCSFDRCFDSTLTWVKKIYCKEDFTFEDSIGSKCMYIVCVLDEAATGAIPDKIQVFDARTYNAVASNRFGSKSIELKRQPQQFSNNIRLRIPVEFEKEMNNLLIWTTTSNYCGRDFVIVEPTVSACIESNILKFLAPGPKTDPEMGMTRNNLMVQMREESIGEFQPRFMSTPSKSTNCKMLLPKMELNTSRAGSSVMNGELVGKFLRFIQSANLNGMLDREIGDILLQPLKPEDRVQAFMKSKLIEDGILDFISDENALEVYDLYAKIKLKSERVEQKCIQIMKENANVFWSSVHGFMGDCHQFPTGMCKLFLDSFFLF